MRQSLRSTNSSDWLMVLFVLVALISVLSFTDVFERLFHLAQPTHSWSTND